MARKAAARYGCTAEGPPGAARLKICVRALLCTSAHLGGGPSSTTNERPLSPIFSDTQADLRRRRRVYYLQPGSYLNNLERKLWNIAFPLSSVFMLFE